MVLSDQRDMPDDCHKPIKLNTRSLNQRTTAQRFSTTSFIIGDIVLGKGMDAFEQLVSEILWMEGYWVRTSVKVELTKEEKRQIDRPSSPRWELDIVAYRGRDNLLRVIECKSYLDSRGVVLSGFAGGEGRSAERYKLFTDERLRTVVFNRLRLQFAESGACGPNADVKLCLACGRIATDADRAGLHKHFAERGWELWDEPWLREHLKRMSGRSYENQVSAVVAKLLLRGKVE
jgi:hypothetical protein